MLKSVVLVSSFVVMAVVPGWAATSPSCAAIDKAISANEDFVEVALGIDVASPADALKTIRETSDRVMAGLSPEAANQSHAAIAAIDAALVANNLPGAAVAAMENYDVLVRAFEPRLVTTRDVASLDYAGFRLLSLVASNPINWTAVAKTAADADANMKATATHLKDQGLTDLMITMSSGLVGAAKAQDAAWQGHAARVLLDSVDLMEPKSRNTSKRACG